MTVIENDLISHIPNSSHHGQQNEILLTIYQDALQNSRSPHMFLKQPVHLSNSKQTALAIEQLNKRCSKVSSSDTQKAQKELLLIKTIVLFFKRSQVRNRLRKHLHLNDLNLYGITILQIFLNWLSWVSYQIEAQKNKINLISLNYIFKLTRVLIIELGIMHLNPNCMRLTSLIRQLDLNDSYVSPNQATKDVFG